MAVDIVAPPRYVRFAVTASAMCGPVAALTQ